MPVSVRITSMVPERAQAALGALLPYPNFDSCLTQCGGQFGYFVFELLFPARGFRFASLDAGLASFQDLTFPSPDRFLGPSFSAGCFGDRELTGEYRQYDADFLFNRDCWWATHDLDLSIRRCISN